MPLRPHTRLPHSAAAGLGRRLQGAQLQAPISLRSPAIPLAHCPSTGGSTRPVAADGDLTTPAAAEPHYSTNPQHMSSLSALIVPLIARDANGDYCEGTGEAPLTSEQIRDMVFEERSPGQVTVASTYNSCTHGQMRLTQGDSLVVEPVALPCNGTSM